MAGSTNRNHVGRADDGIAAADHAEANPSPEAALGAVGRGIPAVATHTPVVPGLGPGTHEFARAGRNSDGVLTPDDADPPGSGCSTAVHAVNSWMPGLVPGMTTWAARLAESRPDSRGQALA